VRDGTALGRCGEVDEGLDVADDRTDLQWNAARRNEPAGDLVDEIVFIARGIVIAEQMNAHRRAVTRCLDRLHGMRVLCLDADDAGGGPDGLHGELHAFHHFGSLTLHHRGILVQQRLGTPRHWQSLYRPCPQA